jgi:hypothetical protein
MGETNKDEMFFIHNVTEFLTSVGAKPYGDGYLGDGYLLPTIAGNLEIHVYGDWIACRYQDIDLALKHDKHVSRYCGKHNWLYREIGNPLIIADFVHWIERLL